MRTEIVFLRELLSEIRNGLDTDQYDEPLDDNMLPITRIETISASVVDFSRVKYALVSLADQEKYRLKSGDILFSHINSPEHIGKAAIFRSDRILIHGINLLLLRPKPERCYAEYLSYYLGSASVRARFRTRCKRAVNQASLNHDDIVSLEVPLPPLPEQQRITSILARADRLRRLCRYALELSAGYLQAVFLEMFGDPMTNPKGWEIDSLDRVITDTKNGFGSRDVADTGGTIVLRIRDVGAGSIDYSEPRRIKMSPDEVAQYRLEDGDLLLVRVNGNPNLVGRASLFRPIGEPVAFSDHIIRVRLDQGQKNLDYLLHLLNSPYGRAQMLGSVTTTAGQFTVNRSGLSRVAIPFPSIDLQEEFAGVVSRYQHLRAQQQEAARQAEHLFQALLHKAFSGEL